MRRSAAAVLALSIASGASAQKVTVGPDLNAPTFPVNLGSNSEYTYQSIMVPHNPLGSNHFNRLRLRFWFDGSPLGKQYYYTQAYLTPDPYSPQDAVGFIPEVNQKRHGFVNWMIRNPGSWQSGQMLWLILSSDYKPAWFDACDVGTTNPICDGATAFTRATFSDTYPGGAYWSCDPLLPFEPECETPGDLLFQAQFHTTPEPGTVILLGSGLLGIGALTLRRRKSTQGHHQ